MRKISLKSVGLFILMTLSMSFKFVKVSIFGQMADAVCDYDYEVGGTVCYPDNPLPFNEWCRAYNVSKAVPKQIIMGREEIATMLGVDSKHLIII